MHLVQRQNNKQWLWKKLGYLGLFPFFGCLLLTLEDFGLSYDFKSLFMTYSAIILSFMAGTIWQKSTEVDAQRDQLFSNVFCLIAFGALLLAQAQTLAVLGLTYLFLWIYEKRRFNDLPKEYLAMRANLTAIVVSLHFIALILWSNV